MPLCDEDNARLSSHATRKLILMVANPAEIARDLWADGIFTKSDLDRINHEVTQEEKIILLMEIMPRRLQSLDQLIPVLSRYRTYKTIVAILTNAASDQETKALVASARRRSIVSFAKPFTFDNNLLEAVDQVRKHYKNNFRFVYPVPGCKEICYEVDDVWVSLDLDSNTSDRGKTEFYRSLLLGTLAQKSVVFFRGIPGAGKSTLAKLICYDWANGKLPRYDLVLFGTLARIKTCDSILDLVLAQMFRRVLKKAQVELLKNELMTGEPRDENQSSAKLHTLIVLDGLDEYTGGCEELDWLLEESDLPNLEYALLITTRPDGMKKVACDGALLNLAGFGIDQQEEYIWKHVNRGPKAAAESDEQKMELEAIKAKVHKSTGLQKLAHTPLILTYVCLVHKELETDTIVELFEKVCLYLVRRFIQEHKAMADHFEGDWRQSQVMQSLCQLALDGLLCNESGMGKVVFSEQDLEKNRVDPICQQIGFLVSEESFEENSVKKTIVYWFHHKSLQDYLAAYALSLELKKVSKISVTIADTFFDRLRQKSGRSARDLGDSIWSQEKADTEAVCESKWLKMVFEHPSVNPIPSNSWQFLLELAAESDEAKFVHNAVTLWLSTNAKLLNMEIEFELLYKLYEKISQHEKLVCNPKESLLFALPVTLSEQIENGYAYPQLLTAILANVQLLHRYDDCEYYAGSISTNIFTDAVVPPYFYTDYRADWMREHCTILAFNNCIVPHRLVGHLCMAMKIYTELSSLKIHVDGPFEEPNISALPMHWRERLPLPEPPPLELGDFPRPSPNFSSVAAADLGAALAADLQIILTTLQTLQAKANLDAKSWNEKLEMTLDMDRRPRTNGKCTVGRLFIECDASQGCDQFELATLLKVMYSFAHIERIVLRGIRQTVAVTDLAATFDRIDTNVLTELRVEKVHIGDDVQGLIKIVSEASKLWFLCIRDTGIDGSELIELTNVVKRSCSLLHIYRVQEQCLQKEGVFERFCKGIQNWKNLDTLQLRGNRLSNKLVGILLQALPTMPGLKLVNLIDNHVTDATLHKLRHCADVGIVTGSY